MGGGAELLGMGHYGYVMTCKRRASNEKVVLKLQGVRWLDSAVREWAHSEEVGNHLHIAQLTEVFMHGDSDHAVQDRIIAGCEASSGPLAGQRPKWFPNACLCLVSEYMDRGSVSSLIEKQLLTLEGVCAVTRQVASALVFMHQKQRNHNDVRPATILLKCAPHGNVLHVKLSDVGAAEHSVDHSLDKALLACAIWCMVVGRVPSRCPTKDERLEVMAEFMKSPLLGRKATGRGTALIETVCGLWDNQLDMPLIVCNSEFEGCEVREPEEDEMKRQLAACADFEVTKRAGASLERFKPDQTTLLVKAETGDPVGTCNEGSIPVVDSRD